MGSNVNISIVTEASDLIVILETLKQIKESDDDLNKFFLETSASREDREIKLCTRPGLGLTILFYSMI